MNTKHLDLFVRVVKAGSITKVANDLFISQPAVTMQLKRLEDEVGVPLFTALGRGIQCTDAGDSLFEYATSILALEGQLLRAMDDHREGKQGKIIIGASDEIATYIIPRTLKLFYEVHPYITVDVQTHEDADIEAMVIQGALDVGLVVLSPKNHFSLRITDYTRDTWIGIESSENPPSVRQIYTTRAGERHMMGRNVAGMALHVLHSTEAVKRFVAAGMGYGVLLHSCVDFELRNRLLNPSSEISPVPHVLSVITRPAEKLSKSLWLFLHHLRDTARSREEHLTIDSPVEK